MYIELMLLLLLLGHNRCSFQKRLAGVMLLGMLPGRYTDVDLNPWHKRNMHAATCRYQLPVLLCHMQLRKMRLVVNCQCNCSKDGDALHSCFVNGQMGQRCRIAALLQDSGAGRV